MLYITKIVELDNFFVCLSLTVDGVRTELFLSLIFKIKK